MEILNAKQSLERNYGILSTGTIANLADVEAQYLEEYRAAIGEF
jgi:hypothetical protein